MAGIDAGRLLGSQVQGGAGVQGAAGAASGLPYLLALLGGAIAPEDSPFKQLGAVVASAAQDQLSNSYLERRRIDPDAPAPVGLTSNNRRLADQQVNQENQQKNVLSLQQRELDLKDQQIKQQKEIADSTFAQRSAEIFSQSQAAAASNQIAQDRNEVLKEAYKANNDKEMTTEKWFLLASKIAPYRMNEYGELDADVDNLFRHAVQMSGMVLPQAVGGAGAGAGTATTVQPQNQQPANTTGTPAADEGLGNVEILKPINKALQTFFPEAYDKSNKPYKPSFSDGLPIANQAVGMGYNILKSLLFSEASPEQQLEADLDAVQNRRLNPTDPDFGNLLTPGTTARKPTKVLSPIR